MKNTIKLLMCALFAFAFASCTPNEENKSDFNFFLSVKENTIVATWSAVDGSAYYELQLNDNEAVKTNKLIFEFTELSYNTTYTVKFNAINAAGESIKSDEKSIEIGVRVIPAYREWTPTNGASAMAISNNGRYVVGGYDHQGIVIDLDTDEMTLTESFELYDVSDNGIAVGSYHGDITDGVAAVWNNGEIKVVDLSNLTPNNRMSNLTGITPDGTYAVGWYWDYDSTAETPSYLSTIYGSIIPFCYDLEKNKITVPEEGNNLFGRGSGALSLSAVAPDRSILGCDQTHNIMVDLIWENEKIGYEYTKLETDDEGYLTYGMGDTNNRFSPSGRYVYGISSTYTEIPQITHPTIYDRTTKEVTLFGNMGYVSAMTDDGVVFLNDAPYGWGTTVFVVDIAKGGEPTEWESLEDWILREHNIDLAKFEPSTDTEPDTTYELDGSIIVGTSADGRKLLGITSTMNGYVNFVIDLDGVPAE